MVFTTRIIEALGLNRDSIALFWTKWCAFIVGLAALGDQVTKLGIPHAWEPYIALFAFWVSISAAQHRTSDLPGADNTVPKSTLDKIAGSVPVVLLAAILGLSFGCASARQAAIVADQTFATAVFAVDDAEFAAWQNGVVTADQHAKLNPKIKQALEDVKAVSQAIKSSPSNLPKSLPALLADLNAIQMAINDLRVLAPDLVGRIGTANAKAIDLLNKLTGGA